MDSEDGAAELRAWMERPSNTSKLTGPFTFGAMTTSPASGDVARVTLAVDPSSSRVTAARFMTFGSGTVIGCLNFLSDWAEGKLLDEVFACGSLDLPTRFAVSPFERARAILATDAFAAAAHEARRSLGLLSPIERERAVAASLEGPAELFDEVAFAGRVEGVTKRFGSGPLDWSRVALRVAAAFMGHRTEEETDPVSRTLEEILADVRYLDGGLRQDVAARAAAVLGRQSDLAATGDS